MSTLCVNCNKFYGSIETKNCCSSCYEEIYPQEYQKQLKLQQKKKEFQEEWKRYEKEDNISMIIQLFLSQIEQEEEKGEEQNEVKESNEEEKVMKYFPLDLLEAILRDTFQSYIRQKKLSLCQLLFQNHLIRSILIRMTPKILSTFITSLRHQYGVKPSEEALQIFDFLANIPEFKNSLVEEDLTTALCISHGTEVIKKMINISMEGVFQITKSSLDSAQYLNKRPHNVPTEEKKGHILLIKNAIENQKKKLKEVTSTSTSSTTLPTTTTTTTLPTTTTTTSSSININPINNNSEIEVTPETILKDFCFALLGILIF